MPSSRFDGKGGQIEEAVVCGGDSVAVGHGYGDERCGYFGVGVGCLD